MNWNAKYEVPITLELWAAIVAEIGAAHRMRIACEKAHSELRTQNPDIVYIQDLVFRALSSEDGAATPEGLMAKFAKNMKESENDAGI